MLRRTTVSNGLYERSAKQAVRWSSPKDSMQSSPFQGTPQDRREGVLRRAGPKGSAKARGDSEDPYVRNIQELLDNPPPMREPEFSKWVQTWFDLEQKYMSPDGELRAAEEDVKEVLRRAGITKPMMSTLNVWLKRIDDEAETKRIAYEKKVKTLLDEDDDALVRETIEGNLVPTDYYSTWDSELSQIRGVFTREIEARRKEIRTRLGREFRVLRL